MGQSLGKSLQTLSERASTWRRESLGRGIPAEEGRPEREGKEEDRKIKPLTYLSISLERASKEGSSEEGRGGL